MAGCAKNEVGKRYGRLLVLSRNGSQKSGTARWLCICDCGQQTTVVSTGLRNGDTQSCGCLQKERQREAVRKPKGQSGLNTLFQAYCTGAAKRHIDWNISVEDFKELTQGACAYCQAAPRQVLVPKTWGEYVYNGIDRVDNLGGYTVGNCVPCCKVCNYIKRDYPIDALFAHLETMIAVHNDRLRKK